MLDARRRGVVYVTKRIMIGLVYEPKAPKTKSFANLLKNMWSSHRLKSNVDPHMLVQAVSVDNVSIAAADSNSKVNIISNLQPELNQDDRAGSDDEETIQRKHQQREAIQSLPMKILCVGVSASHFDRHTAQQ